ncbi:cytochrome c biogenesis protein ResB [Cytobacillus sp. S13-E01]|uniref:cytochrome c biogenesis protein ResB n=1 Tax=Cytobacillus sp. S13-E01 TaxID=3031326 RepID=UPI0023D7DF77|nr:cytochrome c biogenesis protein ResB [Cytobacillus sp. S13-E01]MDF0726174.1 cytochrome c biogenesis protein ResB [Cytobacillus sp. S13-E01]
MEQVKCECGHVNPHGTVLCESCGKPLEDDQNKQLIDMRYEGSARRSQTYNKTFIDRIWNFFSSVKVGVWLIVITLVVSALGTIYPQVMYIPPTVSPSDYYKQEYGFTGQLYYQLGFHNLYGSWWYMILIASIGISLVICSLDRVVPLYRALKKQGVTRHERFLRRQRLFSTTSVDNYEDTLRIIKTNLMKKRYSVREENGNILAEKGRFSRWGPYVNHIGLIIFLGGAMLRFVPGMYIDEVMWVREGETISIPGTEGKYFLKNESFVMEVYEEGKEKEVFDDAIERAGNGMVVKNYQTTVTLYEKSPDAIPGEEAELKKIKDHEIKVNVPLKHDYYALYQVDYKLNELSTMSFMLLDKNKEEAHGTIKIDLRDPKLMYELDTGYSVEIISYFPDFYFDSEGAPTTKSKIPNNPAFVFKMFTPDKPNGEISFVAIQQNIEPYGDNQYKMAFAGIETKDVSALTVRRDFTLWLLGLGGTVFMIGVIQGMYWQHRRVWIQQVNGEMLIAGHTNKNWFGLKNEITSIIKDTHLTPPIDQVQEEQIDHNYQKVT